MMRHLENHRIPIRLQCWPSTLRLTREHALNMELQKRGGVVLVGRQVLHALLASGALAPKRYPDHIPRATIPRVS